MGSKSRIAKHIVPIIQRYIDENNIKKYYEPFVGGANIIDKIDCPKKNWIDYAWKCYYQAVSECSKFDNICVLLVFYLNTTHSARPHPKSVNRQLFNTIETPPEIFLTKNLEDDFFADDVWLEELGKQYSMQCYYSEEQDESDGTYWHYLYFIGND